MFFENNSSLLRGMTEVGLFEGCSVFLWPRVTRGSLQNDTFSGTVVCAFVCVWVCMCVCGSVVLDGVQLSDGWQHGKLMPMIYNCPEQYGQDQERRSSVSMVCLLSHSRIISRIAGV
jgi:hypothetical protein